MRVPACQSFRPQILPFTVGKLRVTQWFNGSLPFWWNQSLHGKPIIGVLGLPDFSGARELQSPFRIVVADQQGAYTDASSSYREVPPLAITGTIDTILAHLGEFSSKDFQLDEAFHHFSQDGC